MDTNIAQNMVARLVRDTHPVRYHNREDGVYAQDESKGEYLVFLWGGLFFDGRQFYRMDRSASVELPDGTCFYGPDHPGGQAEK